MKKVLKKVLGIVTIVVYSVFVVIIPMPIHAEENDGLTPDDGASVDRSIQYPLVAYFEGIEEGVNLDDDVIVVPNGFTDGNVVIKAKVCGELNSTILPDTDSVGCPNKREITLTPEGIINGNQINNTVTASQAGVEIHQGFDDYGKVSVHVTYVQEEKSVINQIINIVTEDLIDIKAEAMLEMSYSLASAFNAHTILTNSSSGDVSIFFGNSEATLIVSGPNVDKITNAVGGVRSVINPDGSVTITLPELFRETTTSVVVTILMKDGNSIEKQINIIRTSILLQYHNGAGDNSVYAGYVFNKAYLYNNQNHSDDIFDAYLQVTLYKDDVVVGFKQIKIDDEEYINSIEENKSGSIELYSSNQIPLYGKITDDLIEGVNRVSVFLTNGPIEFDKELPSIEFGIGSGVTLEWEEN